MPSLALLIGPEDHVLLAEGSLAEGAACARGAALLEGGRAAPQQLAQAGVAGSVGRRALAGWASAGRGAARASPSELGDVGGGGAADEAGGQLRVAGRTRPRIRLDLPPHLLL